MPLQHGPGTYGGARYFNLRAYLATDSAPAAVLRTYVCMGYFSLRACFVTGSASVRKRSLLAQVHPRLQPDTIPCVSHSARFRAVPCANRTSTAQSASPSPLLSAPHTVYCAGSLAVASAFYCAVSLVVASAFYCAVNLAVASTHCYAVSLAVVPLTALQSASPPPPPTLHGYRLANVEFFHKLAAVQNAAAASAFASVNY